MRILSIDMSSSREPIIHAPGVPTYELHTLGWRAFQDLCAVVLREIWGQSVQSFADTKDGGRDGAFYGTWRESVKGVDVPEGPFTLQCKFMARRDDTLTLSSIEDELAKIGPLVEQKLCKSYVLMSNARVTATSEAKIRKALSDAGVAHPLVLAGNWFNQTIATNQRLRMYVPRVYGLGDLSQVLDERVYSQARALLDYLKEDLSTFVVTDAYNRAARTIENHGFCLLLGEPAVGKSVIAATLAMTAVDQWKIPTIKVDGPADFARWNPNEPSQFFWIDDAFGPIRHDRALTDDWAQRMPKVMAAVRGGSKVVMTSRDYIYRDARKLLKEYAYPLLHEQQVVIDVADLSQQERRQILYNHVRLGDQPQEFRAAIKEHLIDAADQKPFRPEVARRLGSRRFTKGLGTSQFSVCQFMAKPKQFLHDVYEGLEADHVGALAMVYQAGELPVPLARPTKEHEDLLGLIGSTWDRVVKALSVLEGTFLRCSPKPGSGDTQAYWAFRHPTLREGFATFVASNPNWLELFVRGLDDDSMLRQLDCGSGDTQGILVTVPESLYLMVAERVLKARPARPPSTNYWILWRSWASFLTYRCSRAFLETYLSLDPELITHCLSFISEMSASAELAILSKLHVEGLLPEEPRAKALEKIGDLAVETPDADWLEDRAIRKLMSDEERAEVLARIKEELIPDLDWALSNWHSNEQGDSAEEYYQPLEQTLRTYEDAFRRDEDARVALREALDHVNYLRQEASYWVWKQEHGDDSASPAPTERGKGSTPPEGVASGRGMFDDVDE